MEAIVLAGGFGTRLREVVADVPKPMAPIAGRPFLEIVLSQLAAKGFSRAVLSLGYLAHKIIDHFGQAFGGMDLVYHVEQTPLGTGGAVRCALEQCRADHVFVLNGDTYLDVEAADVEAQWQRDRRPIIVTTEIADTSRYGRVNTADSRVVGFIDKGIRGRGLINAGCYVFPRDIAAEFPEVEAFSLESDFLIDAVTRMPFDCFVSHGRFIDIGVPDDYKRAQTELMGI